MLALWTIKSRDRSRSRHCRITDMRMTHRLVIIRPARQCTMGQSAFHLTRVAREHQHISRTILLGLGHLLISRTLHVRTCNNRRCQRTVHNRIHTETRSRGTIGTKRSRMPKLPDGHQQGQVVVDIEHLRPTGTRNCM